MLAIIAMFRKDNMRHFYIRVEDDKLPTKIKLIAAKQGVTMAEVIEKALNQYINKLTAKPVD